MSYFFSPEEVCHLIPEVYVVQSLLEDALYLFENKNSFSRTGVKNFLNPYLKLVYDSMILT